MPTSAVFYVNTGTIDDVRGGVGVEFTEVSSANDKLIFSQGSDVVTDGHAIPSETELNAASVLLENTEKVVPKYFLSDLSAGILKEIHNAGNQNKRYVLCFAFDGLTASEPVLQVWDDDGFNSINAEVLGEGDPDYSWYRGICTTGALPGASWVGNRLAGAAAEHSILLNAGAGALTVAKDLYMQFKVVIPAIASFSGTGSPKLLLRWSAN